MRLRFLDRAFFLNSTSEKKSVSTDGMQFESVYFCCGCCLCMNMPVLRSFIKTMMVSGLSEHSDVCTK